jgi:hypothetical protein
MVPLSGYDIPVTRKRKKNFLASAANFPIMPYPDRTTATILPTWSNGLDCRPP